MNQQSARSCGIYCGKLYDEEKSRMAEGDFELLKYYPHDMKQYPWKRFWCPRDGSFSLSDGGYLVDPESEYGKRLNPELVSLSTMKESLCLVLLGEPGIGKSTEFSEDFDRAHALTSGTVDETLFVNLNEYQTDSRLVADVFESDLVRDWLSGQHVLHLYFDSLDEGRLEVKNIANILSGQLRKLASQADRLRLRVACRTSEWPSLFEHTLVSVWGNADVTALELTPLRRIDIESAAIVEGTEPGIFLADIAERNVEAFAINPITLRFLIEVHKRDGELPRSRWELYEQGCKRLCEETNQSRRDAGQLGALSPSQRLEISSRIAALTIFCGRGQIDTSDAADVDVLTIENIEGGVEWPAGSELQVSANAVRETLSTTLFSGRGPHRLGFAHWTYAEFLAARYLIQRKLDSTQVNSLLFHSACPTNVVPQLAETAAWVASSRTTVFENIMSHDPQVLLRSDVATADDGTKARLVDRLIEGFRSGQLDDSDWSQRRHYKKLRNSDLPTRLGPVISDTNADVVTRRFAIDVAEASKESSLVGTLLAVALDATENPHVRGQASHAVIEIADDEECQLLTPLAFGEAGEDPDDELRGSALKGLWSRQLISASDLFEHLPRQQNSSLLGTYRMFLSEDVDRYLQDADLSVALKWCSRNPPYHGGDDVDDLEEPISRIVGRAVHFLHEEDVREAFAEYAVSRMAAYHPVLEDSQLLTEVDVSIRRELIITILRRLPEENDYIPELLFGTPDLLPDTDLRWLLNTTMKSAEQTVGRRLSLLAKKLFLKGDRSDIDHVKHCCRSNSVLDNEFSDLFHAVELRSPSADEMRQRYAKQIESEKRLAMLTAKRKSTLAPPLEERVSPCLQKLRGGDLNWWWMLIRELQHGSTGRKFLHGLRSDVTKLPSWQEIIDEDRDIISGYAQQYLLEWKTSPERWLGTSRPFPPDLSGYQALVITITRNAEFLKRFSDEDWANWAPVILSFPTELGRLEGDSETAGDLQKRLVDAAIQFAPEATLQALDKLIDQDAASHSGHLFILEKLSLCKSSRLENYLLRKTRDSRLPARSVVNLITLVLGIAPRKVQEIALSTFRQYQLQRYQLPKHAKARNTPVVRRSGGRRLLNKNVRRGVLRHSISYSKTLRATLQHVRLRELVKEFATILWVHCGHFDWDRVWLFLTNDPMLLKEVAVDVAQRTSSRVGHVATLSEDQAADLYFTLEKHFPRAEDLRKDRAHVLEPRKSLQHYRDQLLNHLTDRKTPAAVNAIESLKIRLPHLNFLDWAKRSALQKTLEATWTPLSVGQAREIVHKPQSRLVRNDLELQKVILESLQRLQSKLHGENPAVRDIWDKIDKNTWKPVDENAFSDYVKRHLDNDLSNCGIVALREVEIRRGNDANGERTDIYVTATIFGANSGTFDTVRVIVEVKGCWHKELKTAMETQLKHRYLRDNDCDFGIYLVGWFACNAWSTADPRQKATPKWKVSDATDFFASQSRNLSDGGASLEAVVIDASLR